MNSNDMESPSPEKRVQLPDPDVDNITVLTRELPNAPILPWHHYDSPWLESEEADGSAPEFSTDGEGLEDAQDLGAESQADETTGADEAIAPSTPSNLEPDSEAGIGSAVLRTDPPESESILLETPEVTVQTVPPSIPVPLYILQEDPDPVIESPLLPALDVEEPNLESADSPDRGLHHGDSGLPEENVR